MNDEREGMLPALRALGDSLGEAARREIGPATAGGRGGAGGPRTQRWLRRHGRITGIVAGVALVAAGAATAGDLISSGAPERPATGLPTDLSPAGATEPIALRAPDAEAGGAWGLRAYTSESGRRCVVAGWIRGQSIGRVQDGAFRVYRSGDALQNGTCTSSAPAGSASSAVASVREPAPRTLVFGAAGPGVRRVTIDDGEKRHVADVTQGVYLAVLSGVRDARDIRIAPGG